MPLVPFAKASDVQTLAPAVDEERATLILEMVSATIRDSIGWDVDEQSTTYTQTIRRGASLEAVVLPVMNLTAVTSVTVDGVLLSASLYDATEAGVVYLKTTAYESVVVAYTAGYPRTPRDEAPGVFRTVAIDYALRWANNPGGVKSYQMGGTGETFDLDLREIADTDSRLDSYRVTQ